MSKSALAFSPIAAGTVNIDVSASSAQVALGAGNGPCPIRIMNNGTATVWVKFGATGITASLTADFPVGPGVTEVLMAPPSTSALYVAAIAAGATGKIYFTPGLGI